MNIGAIMNANYAQIRQEATLREAANEFSRTSASDLMVVDQQGGFGGVLAGGDLIRAVMPSYEQIIRDGGHLSDALEMFIDRGQELADKPIAPHIIRQALTGSPTDPLPKAA